MANNSDTNTADSAEPDFGLLHEQRTHRGNADTRDRMLETVAGIVRWRHYNANLAHDATPERPPQGARHTLVSGARKRIKGLSRDGQ